MELITRRRESSSGFTLVEIMIVLAVLAVMAAVVIPNVAGFITRGKERAFQADQRLLQAAVDAWRSDVNARAGNPWPTMGGVKGTPVDGNTDGDYLDVGDTDSFLKISLLTTGNYLKGNDVVKSYKYALTALGDTGVPVASVGSYLWYVDANGVVQDYQWTDTNSNNLVNAGETTAGFVADTYP